MIIGVPKEIKPQENRIGAVPAMVLELVEAGNTVLIERGGGLGAGISDEEYTAVGAELVDGASEVYGRAEMIVVPEEGVPPAAHRVALERGPARHHHAGGLALGVRVDDLDALRPLLLGDHVPRW